MKLSIIPVDGTVCENEVCYLRMTWVGTPQDVKALQWDINAGHIEYNDGKPNEEITTLPAWTENAMAAWTEANNAVQPKPTTAEQNQQTAIALLTATDWVNQPDVRNTANVPHLLNGQAFDDYRVAVRIYAVYPVAGDIDWPVKPVEQWSDPFEGIS
jgi:hypothetical protein